MREEAPRCSWTKMKKMRELMWKKSRILSKRSWRKTSWSNTKIMLTLRKTSKWLSKPFIRSSTIIRRQISCITPSIATWPQSLRIRQKKPQASGKFVLTLGRGLVYTQSPLFQWFAAPSLLVPSSSTRRCRSILVSLLRIWASQFLDLASTHWFMQLDPMISYATLE